LILDEPRLNSQYKAVDFIKGKEPVTAAIINSILSIYNLYITEEGLKELVNTPKITFDSLYKDLNKDFKFSSKLGKNSSKEVAGVYIFIHKETGAKYVGSSIQLATRLQRYLSGTYVESGKFLPFLTKEGLDKFTLEVLPIYSSLILKPELILEQYFLLDPTFNLNLSRVANTAGFMSKEMYMYNKDKTILIYSSNSIKDFLTTFGIWHSRIVKSIEAGTYYLGKYVFSSIPILTAKDGKDTISDIKDMLAKDRENKMYMYNKYKTVLLFSGAKRDFLLLGIHAANPGVRDLINSDSLYLGKYILTTIRIPAAKISDTTISDLIEQLRKDRIELKVSTGKGKGVALLNVKTNETLIFKSLSSCAEHLVGIGIKITGSTLKSRIIDGRQLNEYLVKWNENKTYIHSKANPISITNLNTGEIKIYNSIRDAERNTNIW
jgi:GIY-YIG catalytic domain/NUMOD1 domain